MIKETINITSCKFRLCFLLVVFFCVAAQSHANHFLSTTHPQTWSSSKISNLAHHAVTVLENGTSTKSYFFDEEDLKEDDETPEYLQATLAHAVTPFFCDFSTLTPILSKRFFARRNLFILFRNLRI